MFAGHMILLVFTLGGFVLLNANAWLVSRSRVLSWAMAIALTFFEVAGRSSCRPTSSSC